MQRGAGAPPQWPADGASDTKKCCRLPSAAPRARSGLEEVGRRRLLGNPSSAPAPSPPRSRSPPSATCREAPFSPPRAPPLRPALPLQLPLRKLQGHQVSGPLRIPRRLQRGWWWRIRPGRGRGAVPEAEGDAVGTAGAQTWDRFPRCLCPGCWRSGSAWRLPQRCFRGPACDVCLPALCRRVVRRPDLEERRLICSLGR